MANNCDTGFNKGFKSKVIFWTEDNGYKQLPTTVNGYTLPFDSNSVVGKQTIVENNSMNGLRTKNVTSLGSKTVDGSMPVQFDTKSSFFWIFAGLGHYFKSGTLKSKIGNSQLSGTAGTDYVDDTLATWTAITDGEFAVSIDGVANDITGLDFSGATSMSDVASIIETGIQAIGTGGFTNATVKWDSTYATGKYFKITSGTSEEVLPANISSLVSAVSVLSPVSGGVGTDISGVGFLLMDSGNGTAGFDRPNSVGDCVPSLGCERVFEQQIYQQRGLVLGELGFTFNGEGNDRTTLSTTLMGAKEDPVDATVVDNLFDTLNDGQVYNHFEAKVVVYDPDNPTVELARGNIKSASVTLNNNLQSQFVLDGLPEATKIDAQKISISGDMTFLFKTYANSFLQDAVLERLLPIDIIIRKGANEVVLSMPDVKFEVNSPTIDTEASVEVTSNYNATDITITHGSDIAEDYTF